MEVDSITIEPNMEGMKLWLRAVARGVPEDGNPLVREAMEKAVIVFFLAQWYPHWTGEQLYDEAVAIILAGD